jgi:hypothetical protein
MTKQAAAIRRMVEMERFQEEGDDQHSPREFEAIRHKYDDGQFLQQALLNWCSTTGLPGIVPNSQTETLKIGSTGYTPEMLESIRFFSLPAVMETLRRAERLQGAKVSSTGSSRIKSLPSSKVFFEGTFSRKIAIEREDLVFFVPGSDPWTEAIITHALEADRGRCTAVFRSSSELAKTWHVFELFYTVSIDPRPLYAAGFGPEPLSQAARFLPYVTRRLIVTSEGKVVSESSKIAQVIKARPFNEKQGDVSLNDAKRPQLMEAFKTAYPSERWKTVVDQVFTSAQQKLDEELCQNPQIVEPAHNAFRQRLFGQQSALLGLGQSPTQEIVRYKTLSEALLKGLAQPFCQLQSVCFWMLLGTKKA